MVDCKLRGRRVLIVEDEYFIASDLAQIVEQNDATPIGPVSNLDMALPLATRAHADVAIIDVNLGQGPSFAMADHLRERQIPFIFLSGYAPAVGPQHHGGIPWIEKPYRSDGVLRALKAVLEKSEQAGAA